MKKFVLQEALGKLKRLKESQTWADDKYDDLMLKGKDNWDDDDWDAYNYIMNAWGETSYYDEEPNWPPEDFQFYDESLATDYGDKIMKAKGNPKEIDKLYSQAKEKCGKQDLSYVTNIYAAYRNKKANESRIIKFKGNKKLNERSPSRYFEPAYSERYKVLAFYGNDYRGLVDDFSSDNFDEISDKAHEFLSDGNLIVVNDYETGKQIRLTPDDYFDGFQGEGISPYMFESFSSENEKDGKYKIVKVGPHNYKIEEVNTSKIKDGLEIIFDDDTDSYEKAKELFIKYGYNEDDLVPESLNENLMDAVFDRIADPDSYDPKEFYNYLSGWNDVGWYDNVVSALDGGTDNDVSEQIIKSVRKIIKDDGGNPDNPNAKQLYDWIKNSTWVTTDKTADTPEYLKNL